MDFFKNMGLANKSVIVIVNFMITYVNAACLFVSSAHQLGGDHPIYAVHRPRKLYDASKDLTSVRTEFDVCGSDSAYCLLIRLSLMLYSVIPRLLFSVTTSPADFCFSLTTPGNTGRFTHPLYCNFSLFSSRPQANKALHYVS